MSQSEIRNGQLPAMDKEYAKVASEKIEQATAEQDVRSQCFIDFFFYNKHFKNKYNNILATPPYENMEPFKKWNPSSYSRVV